MIRETAVGVEYQAVAAREGESEQPARMVVFAPDALDSRALARLGQLVLALQSAKGVNLLVPWELGVVDGHWALAMPDHPGCDAGALMEFRGAGHAPVPLAQIVHVIAEAANGLASLHQRGLVHGGIGTQDLLLGVDGSVKLSCDSLAPVLAEIAASSPATSRATKRYRAPELGRHSSHTASSDVFALAAVALDLFSGALPDGRDGPKTFAASEEKQAEMPPELESILQKALEIVPSRRHENAAALRDALWEYLDGMGEVVTPLQLAELASSASPGARDPRPFEQGGHESVDLPVTRSFSLGAAPDVKAGAEAGKSTSSRADLAPAGAPYPERTQRIELYSSDEEDLETDSGLGSPLDLEQLISEGEHVKRPRPRGSSRSNPELSLGQSPDAIEAPMASQIGSSVEVDLDAKSPQEPSARAKCSRDPIISRARRHGHIRGEPSIHETDLGHHSPMPDPDGTRIVRGDDRDEDDLFGPVQRQPSVGSGARMRLLTASIPIPIAAAIAFACGSAGYIAGQVTTKDRASHRSRDAQIDARLPATETGSGVVAKAGELPWYQDEASAGQRGLVSIEHGSDTAAKGRQGRLSIKTNRRSRVYIDGLDTGLYTPIESYPVHTGRREVTLVTAEGGRHTDIVTIMASETTVLEAEVR